MKKTFYYFICFTLSTAYANEVEINQLLNRIEISEIQFERNGQKHSGQEARKHLEKKFNWAKRWKLRSQPIKTEDFIQKIASRSSTTGEDYHVILTDGSKIKTEKWLNTEWEKIKLAKESQTPPSPR